MSMLDSPLEIRGTSSGQLSRNEIFDVLSNERRQYVLHYLKEQDDRAVSLRELVDHVAAWENDTAPDRIDSDERKRVYTALRQSHLPRLEEAGIVDYEHLRGEVTLNDEAREVQMYLEYVPANDIPWSHCYLGLSGVGALLLAVTHLGMYPFGNLSGVTLSAILLALFAVSAAVHTYQSSRNRLGSERFDVEQR